MIFSWICLYFFSQPWLKFILLTGEPRFMEEWGSGACWQFLGPRTLWISFFVLRWQQNAADTLMTCWVLQSLRRLESFVQVLLSRFHALFNCKPHTTSAERWLKYFNFIEAFFIFFTPLNTISSAMTFAAISSLNRRETLPMPIDAKALGTQVLTGGLVARDFVNQECFEDKMQLAWTCLCLLCV